LKRGLERNELTLYYQPKISLQEDRVVGVEALVRWLHPSQGLINPPEFVPIAEDTGLFGAIGEWVLHAACAQLRAWQSRGMDGLRLAVNLSMRQFAQDNLIERVREAAHTAGIDPKQIDIEITESVLMRNADRAGRLLSQLKDAGVQIVIDDFGTGHSSLGVLKRFPVDGVKIDRSLVAQLPGCADAVEVTRAVIAMAHSLNLRVCGEGVETRPQWEFLREHGCDAVQGNYFCAPSPADAVAGMLLQQPGGALRTGNVQQLRPWRAARPGDEAV
jgi:EAL domain-containing protein (putative c-di-GMP-specific phosphodiesterase class I)